MAAATLRELSVNPFGVGQIMTIAALRDSFVLVGMTADAGNITVLGFGRCQLAVRQVMTGGAENILC